MELWYGLSVTVTSVELEFLELSDISTTENVYYIEVPQEGGQIGVNIQVFKLGYPKYLELLFDWFAIYNA